MDEHGIYKSVVIFLLTICVISLALGIYANYRLIVINRENHQEKENDNKEVEIKDNITIDKIKRNQTVLKNYTGDQFTFVKSRIYEKDMTSKDLDEEKKLVAVIYSLYNEFDSFVELDSSKYPNITPNEEGATKIIEAKEVKELYENVFNGKLDVNTEFPEDVKNNFYYNSEYDIYVVNAGFGGTCGDGTLTYDYKYTEDKNNVYVYSSFAYVKNCPYEVYKDLEMKDKYEAEESFELNNDNYKDFNKYKITYKKDKSNYIFDSIKVLK